MPKTSAATLLKRLESFPWDDWNDSLAKGISQPYRDLVVTTAQAAAKKAGADLSPNDPLLSRFMTKYVMERSTQLNATTKEAVADVIRGVFESGVDADQLNQLVLDKVREQFDGYEQWRANRIARSETAIGYNHANILGFAQADVEEVEVVDGTDDDICEAANGEVWTLSESLSDPIGHPNCTRSFIPIVPEDDEESRRAPREKFEIDDDLAFICAIASEMIIARDDPHADRVLDAIED